MVALPMLIGRMQLQQISVIGLGKRPVQVRLSAACAGATQGRATASNARASTWLAHRRSAGILGRADLEQLKRLFQKRHLLAHSDGIVDQRYINESGDMTYKVGQRITVSTSEVDDIVAGIGRLVAGLRSAIGALPERP
jgi:hypothetical protein